MAPPAVLFRGWHPANKPAPLTDNKACPAAIAKQLATAAQCLRVSPGPEAEPTAGRHGAAASQPGVWERPSPHPAWFPVSSEPERSVVRCPPGHGRSKSVCDICPCVLDTGPSRIARSVCWGRVGVRRWLVCSGCRWPGRCSVSQSAVRLSENCHLPNDA